MNKPIIAGLYNRYIVLNDNDKMADMHEMEDHIFCNTSSIILDGRQCFNTVEDAIESIKEIK